MIQLWIYEQSNKLLDSTLLTGYESINFSRNAILHRAI
jgi:hypothetical protein